MPYDAGMTSYEKILTDDPAVGVRRITLNRPEKRNALDNTLRGEVFHALEAADRDEERDERFGDYREKDRDGEE